MPRHSYFRLIATVLCAAALTVAVGAWLAPRLGADTGLIALSALSAVAGVRIAL